MEYLPSYTDSLMHHGIKGQKWGVRRFQTESGDLTPQGKKRYSDSSTDKMKPSKSDSAVTKQVKRDWQNMDEAAFRRKYAVSKRKYAKRVAKSPTGDPYGDVRAKMTKNGPNKRFDRAVEKEANQMASVRLAEKAEKVRDSRSFGSRLATTLLTGRRGDTAYNTARAAGASKLGAGASTAILGAEKTMNIADAAYKNSREGKAYIKRTKNNYYK